MSRDSEAKNATHYQSFVEFVADVRHLNEMCYGWVGGRFYQLYPGGRCVDFTTTLCPEAVQSAVEEGARELDIL